MKALAWSAILAVALASACKQKPSPSAPAASSAPAVPSAAPSAALAPVAVPSGFHDDLGARVLAPAKSCRALEVKGRVVDAEGRPVITSAPLDRAKWLDMDRNTSLAVKNTESGRELVFTGPGRVYPCVDGEERFYLARGGVRTAASAGARPGAEVLVGTPHGVVRYGDARLDVKVERGAITIRADIGDAWFETRNADGNGISEEKIAAGTRFERKGLSVDVKALVGTCETTAQAAEERARAVLKPGPSDQATPLGTRTAEHMRARRAARFACVFAGAALGTIENGGDRDALDQAVGRAEARFRGLPSKPSDAEKSESR